jgi:hypothetical protein
MKPFRGHIYNKVNIACMAISRHGTRERSRAPYDDTPSRLLVLPKFRLRQDIFRGFGQSSRHLAPIDRLELQGQTGSLRRRVRGPSGERFDAHNPFLNRFARRRHAATFRERRLDNVRHPHVLPVLVREAVEATIRSQSVIRILTALGQYRRYLLVLRNP